MVCKKKLTNASGLDFGFEGKVHILSLRTSFAVLSGIFVSKNFLGKDRRRQLLYFVNLIRACKKVLYQLVYIGKKFVFLKEPLYLINQ